MPRLQFFPKQPHHLLQLDDDEVLESGREFDASDEDAEILLANEDIRLAPGSTAGAPARSTTQSPTGTANNDDEGDDVDAS